MFIYDLSGSMWAELNGEIKHHAARSVVNEVLGEVEGRVDLGLIAYGHRRKGDCTDIETILGFGASESADRIGSFLQSAVPTGRTPLTSALDLAEQDLSSTAGGAAAGAVVLLTDGEESCSGDPCALAQSWVDRGSAPEVHVVGFGLSDEDVAPMSCLAELTGGSLTTAADARALSRALTRVVSRAETKSLREQVRSMAQLMDGLEADLARANAALQTSENAREETARQLESALNREVELKHESRDLWSRLSDKNVQIDQLESDIIELNRELSVEREERDRLTVRLTAAQKMERELLGEKTDLLVKLSSLRADFDQQVASLARVSDDLADLGEVHDVAILERDRVRELLLKREREAVAARLTATKAVLTVQKAEIAREDAEITAGQVRLERVAAQRRALELERTLSDVSKARTRGESKFERVQRERDMLELELRKREEALSEAAEQAKRARAAAEETEARNIKLKEEMMATSLEIQAVNREKARVKASLAQRETRLAELTKTTRRRELEIRRLLKVGRGLDDQ